MVLEGDMGVLWVTWEYWRGLEVTLAVLGCTGVTLGYWGLTWGVLGSDMEGTGGVLVGTGGEIGYWGVTWGYWG